MKLPTLDFTVMFNTTVSLSKSSKSLDKSFTRAATSKIEQCISSSHLLLVHLIFRVSHRRAWGSRGPPLWSTSTDPTTMEALWTYARFHRHNSVCTEAKGRQVKLLFININQLDALNFIISLFSSLYMFRAHVLIVRRVKIVSV